MRRPAIALFAVLLLGAAGAADVVWPASRPQPQLVTPATPGGVWGCPFLYAGNGRAWLHLVNVADEASRVRITYVRDGAPPVVSNLNLGGRRAGSITFNKALRRASAAIVEYAGGSVFVSRTAVVDNVAGGRSGGVGAACTRASTGLVAVPTGSTLGSETLLSLLNVASSDATVDISILTRDDDLRPERLQGFIVPARERRVVRIGDYAFDEGSSTAVVRVRTGSVVADGLLATGAGLSLIPAQVPATSLVGIAIAERGSARLDVLAPGEDDSVLDASLLTPAARSALVQAAEDGVEASVPTTFALESGRPFALAATLSVRDGGSIVAATRWQAGTLAGGNPRRRIDIGAAPGLVASRRLVAVSGPPANGSQTKIVIANPGAQTASVTLTLLRGGPPVVLGVRTVEPGRVLAIDAGKFGGVVGIAAESDMPVAMILAGLAPQSRLFAAFGIAALPIGEPPRVSVEIDPRLGVPAR